MTNLKMSAKKTDGELDSHEANILNSINLVTECFCLNKINLDVGVSAMSTLIVNCFANDPQRDQADFDNFIVSLRNAYDLMVERDNKDLS